MADERGGFDAREYEISYAEGAFWNPYHGIYWMDEHRLRQDEENRYYDPTWETPADLMPARRRYERQLAAIEAHVREYGSRETQAREVLYRAREELYHVVENESPSVNEEDRQFCVSLVRPSNLESENESDLPSVSEDHRPFCVSLAQHSNCESSSSVGNMVGNFDVDRFRRRTCFKCGAIGHPASVCTFDILCYICRKRGHKSVSCPQTSKQLCVKCGDYGHMYSQCSNDGPKCYYCKEFGHVDRNGQCPKRNGQKNQNEKVLLEAAKRHGEHLTCLICLTNPRQIMYWKCRHIPVCRECDMQYCVGEGNKNCFVCRSVIQERILIYL